MSAHSMTTPLATLIFAIAAVLGPAMSREAVAQVTASGPVDAAETYGCLICHKDKRAAFRLGVHSDRGVKCHDCHGGDPAAFEILPAHAGDFRGALSKITEVEVCGGCHGDPDQMRQYGLPADQIAELRTSRHGQLLLDEGNLDAPSCADCHDPHITLRSDDARSNVYPTNISRTCARCHDDENLMRPYGIPTGQVAEHAGSRHGVAIYQDGNFAAPTCIGCHGSHAALPPSVSEISNVCGHCHVNVRMAFEAGPHGQTGLGFGCTACHGNHDTERVATADLAETCQACHEAEGAAGALAEEIETVLARAERDIELAEEALRELREGGHEISDENFRYRGAYSDLQILGGLQHSLDLTQMQDVGRLVASASRDIRTRAEVSAEEKWEHKLFLLPIWFFTLGIVFMAGMRLRRLGARTGEGGDGDQA